MLTERFNKALSYASEVHKNQYRKVVKVPFIAHLISAAALVLEDRGTEDETISALLHDAVEDQRGMETLNEIRTLFGENVANIVLECSDTDISPKPPWKERKEYFIKKIDTISDSAIRVIIADKLHNLRTIIYEYQIFGEKIWNNFKAGRDGTLWYFSDVYKRLSRVLTLNN